jgi:Tol biopolymer transport system component
MIHFSCKLPGILSLFILIPIVFVFPQKYSLGIFEDHDDIGKIAIKGSVKYDAVKKNYLITGSGENMWFSKDAFHYVWKKVSGDVSLSTDINWIGRGVNAHRKACLIIRQNLDEDSPYADAALHGDGLTSLQYREEQGGLTREIQSNVSAPLRLKIEKEGDYVFMSVAGKDKKLKSAGGSFRLKLNEPFYIGLGVCSHDTAVIEKAIFSNVEILSKKIKTGGKQMLESTLETIAIASKDRRVVYQAQEHFEAPNWSHDGKYFLFNQDGKIYRLPVKGVKPELINTGFALKCNNDHGISPDGKQLVISDQTKDGKSYIYILPIEGGDPKLITKLAPSYWHGWSPDAKTLAYCAERNGEYDIYTIPVEGGEEKRLTDAPGLDDGPDYSPDGQYIYFNSERTGTMQIWRMKTDGSSQEQITWDEYNNWFAHPSPDGKWIVFLSYEKDVKGHPANKDVMLRIMPAEGGKIEVLAKLFGGQGTINVPSWSPDSANLAFVSYRLINP